uniref:Peptidase S1 domain-containing protein n=1 Tax=Steinernema glaseri TaxID=37863 RepID=A0A1I7YQU9_9BILA
NTNKLPNTCDNDKKLCIINAQSAKDHRKIGIVINNGVVDSASVPSTLLKLLLLQRQRECSGKEEGFLLR